MAMSCNIANVIFAQDLPKVIPPSPVAAALQRYGDYPVNHYTGIPDIQIPIYTITAGDIEVPISLTYHSAGAQLNDLLSGANYVGLGWSLQTGGLISRNINGLPDEVALTTAYVEHEGWEYDYTSEYSAMKNLEDRFGDTEYDIYSFNFLGRSGKFITYPDWKPGQTEWKPFLFKNEDLKFDGPLSTYDGTTIIDEEGRSFYFGGFDAVEYADYFDYAPQAKSAQSSWYLSGIGSAKYPGDFVSYHYQPGPEINRYSHSGNFILDSWQHELPYTYIPFSYATGNNLQLNGNNISYKTFLPQRIDFPDGYILFTLDNTKMLNKIEVFDSKNNLIKTVSLQLDYYALSGHNAKKLTSIIFKDAAGTQQETYSFNYLNEQYPYITGISAGKDHWGFVNGAQFNSSDYIMPFHLNNVWQGYGTVNVNFTGSNREPNEFYTKLFALSRITYPTKGYTEFEFEGNRTTEGIEVGGLRIKSISSYSQNGQLTSKKDYTYVSGHREVIPSLDLYRTTGTFLINSSYETQRTKFSDDPMVDPAPKGSPLTYVVVTEKEGQLTTEYRYEDDAAYEYDYLNFPGYHSGDIYDFRYKKFAHKYKPWNFGNLYYKRTWGPGFENVEYYSYEEFLSDTTHDLLLERVVNNECVHLTHEEICGGSIESKVHTLLYSSIYNFSKRYFLSGGKRLVYKSVDNTGSDGRTVRTGIQFFYDNTAYPNQITRQTTTNSKGEEIVSELKYARDFPGQAPYTTMVDQHRIAEVIKQTNSIVKSGGNQFLSSATTHYADWGNSVVLPQNIEVQKNGTPYTAVRYHGYNDKAKVTEVSKENSHKLSYIWGYDARLPIAECTNAGTGEIAYTSFETAEKGNWVYSGTPAFESGTPTGTMAYWLNGSNPISRMVPAGGGDYIVSYWTTSPNALSIPGTKNGYPMQGNTVNNWHYFEHVVTGLAQVDINASGCWIDELRFYPATAQMATYTYRPLIGMTSACDIKNSIRYYEYDAAGRLSIVRDQDKNVLQKICYNYAGQQVDCGATIYYSKAQCRYFKSQTCPVDYLSDSVEYCIAADKYSSTVSPGAADALAEAELVANGQALADQKAQCHKIYYNDEKTAIFHRTDCLGGVPGPPVPYTVPARKYSSLVGPEEVENLALYELNTQGPLNAIRNSECAAWGNAEINRNFGSSHCPQGYEPDPYPVFIPANFFISTIDQAHADQKALDSAYYLANRFGTCTQYATIPLEMNNTSGRNQWIISLYKDDTGETYIFDTDGDPYPTLGYVTEGSYKIIFESYYSWDWFEMGVACGDYEWGNTYMEFEHQMITPSCNTLWINLRN